jgi:hypothetical protein
MAAPRRGRRRHGVGTVTVVVLRRLNHATTYPWAVVLINAGISIACNALHAGMGPALRLPSIVAMGVSAIPALNLALSVHLLVALVDALATVLASAPGQPVESIATRPLQEVANADGGGASGERHPPERPSARSAEGLKRQAWAWAQTHRRPDGSPPSGSEIARAFQRSPRWGRLVKSAGTAGELE